MNADSENNNITFANDTERHGRRDEYQREKSSVICYKCGDRGHIFTQCTEKEADKKTFIRENRVEQCSLAVHKRDMNYRGQIF